MGQTARRVGRYQVGDVAHHKDLARVGVENDFRRHPGIATADHHHFRLLPGLGELMIAAALERQAGLDERAIAVGKARRESHTGALSTA